MKNKLSTRKGKDGYYHFYYGRKNINSLWHYFFSQLSIDQEKNCVELFLKNPIVKKELKKMKLI